MIQEHDGSDVAPSRERETSEFVAGVHNHAVYLVTHADQSEKGKVRVYSEAEVSLSADHDHRRCVAMAGASSEVIAWWAFSFAWRWPLGCL